MVGSYWISLGSPQYLKPCTEWHSNWRSGMNKDMQLKTSTKLWSGCGWLIMVDFWSFYVWGKQSKKILHDAWLCVLLALVAHKLGVGMDCYGGWNQVQSSASISSILSAQKHTLYTFGFQEVTRSLQLQITPASRRWLLLRGFCSTCWIRLKDHVRKHAFLDPL